MPSQEFIGHEPEDVDAWICVCGNKPDGDGFYPCDRDGEEVEPTRFWVGWYVCAACGRIIDPESRRVVGWRLQAA